MRKAGGCGFGMANDDLLEIFHAPQIAILAYRTEIEARHAERLRSDFRVPAIEAAEIEVGRAVPETASFDRVQVIDQENEDVPVGCIEGRRVLWKCRHGDCRSRSTSRARRAPSSAYRPCHCRRCAARLQPAHGQRSGRSLDW